MSSFVLETKLKEMDISLEKLVLNINNKYKVVKNKIWMLIINYYIIYIIRIH